MLTSGSVQAEPRGRSPRYFPLYPNFQIAYSNREGRCTASRTGVKCFRTCRCPFAPGRLRVEASEQTYALIEMVEAEHPARLRRTEPTPIKNRAMRCVGFGRLSPTKLGQ